MNKKSILFILVLSVVLTLSISSVSATDSSDIISMDNSHLMTESIDNSPIMADSIDNNLMTESNKSFGDIQTLIDNAKENESITLSGTYMGNGTPITINKAGLKIIGTNNTILNACNLSSILINNANNVTIENITFMNGSDTYGGAILSNASINIHNSNFNSNFAVLGGVIFINSTIFKINNCLFSENMALWGGAIYMENSFSFIDNCTFNNISAMLGSVIFSNYSINIIRYSIFKDNVAGDGVIYATNSNFIFTDSKFINNNAQMGGVILFKNNPNSYLINCSFENNIVYEESVMIVFNSNVDMLNCSFNNNEGYDSGAIEVDDDGIVMILNSKFTNNYGKYGGAILNYNQLYVYNSTFENNSAEIGGAILSDGNTTILNSQFYLNNATYGAAIAIESNNTVVNNTLFLLNNANTCGGAIYCNASDFEILNSNFSFNTANYTGGAITVAHDIDANGLVSNCNFNNNTAEIGGAINWGGNNGHVTLSEFSLNSAEIGGAICWRGSNGIIDYSVFEANTGDYGDCVISKIPITVDYNYWCNNASTVEEFKNTGVLAYNKGTNPDGSIIVENYAPNNWILMSIHNVSEIVPESNVNFTVGLDTLTNGIDFEEFTGDLPVVFTKITIGDEDSMLFIKNSENFSTFIKNLVFDIIAISPVNNMEEARFSSRVDTFIEVYNKTVKVGTDDVLAISIIDEFGNPVTNKSLIVEFGSQCSYYKFNLVTDDNGLVYVPLKDLTGDYYDVDVRFNGDDMYNASTGLGYLHFISLNTSIQFKVIQLDNGKYLIKGIVIDENGNPVNSGYVNVVINGVATKKVKVNEDGTFSIIVKGPKHGTFDITVNYSTYEELPEPSNYTDSSLTISYTVKENNINNLPATGNPLLILIITLLSLPILRLKK